MINYNPARITLRDYLAIHSTQPGCNEICAIAGFHYADNQVWVDEKTSLGTFNQWFTSMPIEKQLDLCSKVKYAQADSMLRVRELKND